MFTAIQVYRALSYYWFCLVNLFSAEEYRFHEDMTHPTVPDSIFVFGSNLEGIHSGGSAWAAFHHYGAVWGADGADGITDRAYAIPTCHVPGGDPRCTLDEIQQCVHHLGEFAELNDELTFFITRIGTGISGYKDSDIAPMFKGFPSNCDFPIEWKPYLTE